MTRHLVTIGEHTIDASLLTPGGNVLDAGCRDFTFSRGMVERGCHVIAVDADPTVEDPKLPGIYFMNVALAAAAGERFFLMHSNPEARCLISDNSQAAPRVRVKAETISHLTTSLIASSSWDAVKLDVEGAEYEILQTWPGPIAKQISIEFHEHCGKRPQSLYDDIFAHLGQWYDVAQHVLENRHYAGLNHWDSLFILREEFQ